MCYLLFLLTIKKQYFTLLVWTLVGHLPGILFPIKIKRIHIWWVLLLLLLLLFPVSCTLFPPGKWNQWLGCSLFDNHSLCGQFGSTIQGKASSHWVVLSKSTGLSGTRYTPCHAQFHTSPSFFTFFMYVFTHTVRKTCKQNNICSCSSDSTNRSKIVRS